MYCVSLHAHLHTRGCAYVHSALNLMLACMHVLFFMCERERDAKCTCIEGNVQWKSEHKISEHGGRHLRKLCQKKRYACTSSGLAGTTRPHQRWPTFLCISWRAPPSSAKPKSPFGLSLNAPKARIAKTTTPLVLDAPCSCEFGSVLFQNFTGWLAL